MKVPETLTDRMWRNREGKGAASIVGRIVVRRVYRLWTGLRESFLLLPDCLGLVNRLGVHRYCRY